MPYYKKIKTKVRWNKSAYRDFRAGLSPERIAQDEAALQRIFNAAAKSPTAQEALKWAQDNDIDFFIDRASVGLGGYYSGGAGTVAIAEQHADNITAYTINVLVHELRHAWQDSLDLITAGQQSFVETYIKKSLIEADAYAYGCRAKEEFLNEQEMAKLTVNPVKEEEQKPLTPMWDHFKNWYVMPQRSGTYGDIYSLGYGSWLGIVEVERKDFKAEFQGVAYVRVGIETDHKAPLLSLGNGFSGGNYFPKKEAEAIDFFAKKVLQPSKAFNFYGQANFRQRQLASQIRKLQLKAKLKP